MEPGDQRAGDVAPDAAAIVVRAIEADAVHVAPNGTIDAIRSWTDDVFADLER